MSDLHAKLLHEDVSDGTYVGVFKAFGLQFTITWDAGGVEFLPRASRSNPKRPNWQVEAACRLCQMAAGQRVNALQLRSKEEGNEQI